MKHGHLAPRQNQRRKWFEVVCSAGMLLLVPTSGRAQGVTFTQVTTGDIVNTPGSYWSESWGDYDDDGWLDVFVGSSIASTTNYLYRNNHDGTFTLKDADMPKIPSNQHGSAWGDYDNDGHLDLIVTSGNPEVAHNVLYHNNGDGTLSGITTDAIYNDPNFTELPGSHGPRWIDYNNDGLIDLFIAGHDLFNRLFRNAGGGSFTRITNHVLVNDVKDSASSAWIDYDNDGDLDLFVPTFTYGEKSNALYRNDQGGVFTRVVNSGLSTPSPPGDNTTAACWADYDNDGFLDVFFANLSRTILDHNQLFHNNGNGTFSEVVNSVLAADHIPPDWYFLGCPWGDYDNDGFVDLIVTSVNVPFNADGTITSHNYLYRNAGDGTFTKVTQGSIVTEPTVGIASWADYDNDGFLDLFLARGLADPVQRTNLLYHNDGNANAWLNVKLVGTVSNRSGIGAKVRVNAFYGGASHWQRREISSSGNQTIESLNAEFGLGNATTIDTLRIEWPSGIVQEFQNLAPRQFLTIVEVGGIDTDGDGNPDTTDNCPTAKNASQADGDTDLVGDLCDNCTTVNNSRVPGWTFALGGAAYLAANPWATLTGGQRDDDHDGFGNICDGDFTNSLTTTAADTAQYKASIGTAKVALTCGTPNVRPCAIFDLNSANSTESSASGISAADTARYKLLIGSAPGPRCAVCTGTGSVPLPCEAGSAGACN